MVMLVDLKNDSKILIEVDLQISLIRLFNAFTPLS